MPDSWQHHRAKLAAKRRYHPEASCDAELAALRAARAEDYIKRLVETAPPLTADQRERLAVLLRAGVAA